MRIFIPTNELNEKILNQGFSFKPFNIESYLYHFSSDEKTQNLFNKKVNMGTEATNNGKTCKE